MGIYTKEMCSAAKVVPGVWFDDSPLDVSCCEFLRTTYLTMASRYSYSLNSWRYDAVRFKHLFLLHRHMCPLRLSGAVSERYTLLHPYFVAVKEKYLWSKAEFTTNSSLCQIHRVSYSFSMKAPAAMMQEFSLQPVAKHHSRSPCLTPAANHVPGDHKPMQQQNSQRVLLCLLCVTLPLPNAITCLLFQVTG